MSFTFLDLQRHLWASPKPRLLSSFGCDERSGDYKAYVGTPFGGVVEYKWDGSRYVGEYIKQPYSKPAGCPLVTH